MLPANYLPKSSQNELQKIDPHQYNFDICEYIDPQLYNVSVSEHTNENSIPKLNSLMENTAQVNYTFYYFIIQIFKQRIYL